ncbi:Leucine Rich Repeat [Seminavis robusta]|uniref:Leucine Rich Repeat n=1 Tax=Seminavis robusta TaxID=568900 RepID=A0A9N8EIE0_9STRA|nr:Leucine Rich Repeat [Seminavis robusta]|eukprot:Sro1276_g258540.1 Leucine Rich Repeat (608) ;mRNA; f:5933-7861
MDNTKSANTASVPQEPNLVMEQMQSAFHAMIEPLPVDCDASVAVSHNGMALARASSRRPRSVPGAHAVVATVVVTGEDPEIGITSPDPASPNLAEARPVDEEANLPEAEVYDPSRRRDSRKENLMFTCKVMALGILVLLAITVPTVLLRRTHDSTEYKDASSTDTTTTTNTNMDPTQPSVVDQILSLLPVESVKAIDPANSGSTTAQSKAFKWLLGDPSLGTYSNKRIIQRFALATFYHSTEGPRWFRNDNWLNYSSHECNWYMSHDLAGNEQNACCRQRRYTCGENLTIHNPQGLYEKIYLRNNNVNGELPPELFLLTSMDALVLSECPELRGSLASTIGNMENLRFVDLRKNKLLSGSIPTEVGLLTNLVQINIIYTRVTGSIPSELGLLSSNLTKIFIDSNMMSGAIPSEIGRLTNLQYLQLFGQSLKGEVPTEFGMLTSLTRLALSDNRLTGPLPSLGALSDLTDLHLDGNSFTGTISSSVGLMFGLKSFVLGDNLITGTLASEIGLLFNLQILSVEKNNIGGSIPQELSLLANNGSLVSLSVAGNVNLLGTIPQAMCSMGTNSTTCPQIEWRVISGGCGLTFDCTNLLCGCSCPVCSWPNGQ